MTNEIADYSKMNKQIDRLHSIYDMKLDENERKLFNWVRKKKEANRLPNFMLYMKLNEWKTFSWMREKITAKSLSQLHIWYEVEWMKNF
jgi:hypothetical protein